MVSIVPLVTLVILLSVSVLCALALFGFGYWQARFLRLSLPGAALVALGMVPVLMLGGWLNLLGWAKAPALDGVALTGLLLALAGLLIGRRHPARAVAGPRLGSSRAWRLTDLPIAAWGLLLCWQAVTHAPLVNIRDDLEKYLIHPLHMLGYGTVGGNPFLSIGDYTLGGQAFLQGFVAAHFDPAAVRLVDILFFQILFLLTLRGCGQRVGASPGFVVLVVAATAFMDPMSINVSSLFSAALLLFLLLILPFLPGADAADADPWSWRRGVSFGTLAGALVALKNTLIPILALVFLVSLVLSLATGGERRKAILAFWGWTLTAGLVLVAPWMAASIPWAWLRLAPAAAPVFPSALPPLYKWSAVSPHALYLGTMVANLHYTIVFTLLFLLLALLLADLRKHRSPPPAALPLWRGWIGSMLAVFLVYVVFLIPKMTQIGWSPTGLRLSLTWFLALLPAALLLAWGTCAGTGRRLPLPRRRAFLFGVVGTILGVFAIPFVARIQTVLDHGPIPLFRSGLSGMEVLPEVNRDVLSAHGKQLMARLQQAIPPGQGLWIFSPLAINLDFRRNPVFVFTNSHALVDGYLDVPAMDDARGWLHLFRHRLGIEYLVWHENGYPTFNWSVAAKLAQDRDHAFYPRLARLLLGLHRMLMIFQAAGQQVYRVGDLVVIRLPESLENRPMPHSVPGQSPHHWSSGAAQ
ncbi:MAG: hypothetical protein HQL82_11980 [Magnetococcales bacterium]|nr:hypothetical protein [Magnetococcales bacterium]